MTFDLILYHADCVDGFTAAWVAKKACPDAELVACKYGEAPPDVSDRRVLIVDFSFKRDDLVGMHHHAGELLVLDHHKSAAKELAGLDFCVFDMERSGARMALDHFWPRADGSEIREAPPGSMETLVDYVQDRDLWRWKLLRSREISALIATYPFTLEAYDALAQRLVHGFDNAAQAGEDVLRYQERLVERIAQHAQVKPFEIAAFSEANIHTKIAGAAGIQQVNSPVLQGELGEYLTKRAIAPPFVAIYFIDEHGDEVWSLRSGPDGADVSEIAKSFGGGGHKHAAGFTRRRS